MDTNIRCDLGKEDRKSFRVSPRRLFLCLVTSGVLTLLILIYVSLRLSPLWRQEIPPETAPQNRPLLNLAKITTSAPEGGLVFRAEAIIENTKKNGKEVVCQFTVEVVYTHPNGVVEIYIVDGLKNDTKVKALRRNVATHFHIEEPNHLTLFFNNQELFDARTLGFYKIKMGSAINAQSTNF